jgi:serine/threonine-protein kinase RsbW
MSKPKISGNVIVIPSDTVYIAAVDEFIENKLEEIKLSKSVKADIAISVSEIVNNAILHGNSCDVNKKVTVKINIRKDEVEITIKDQGKGFNLDVIPNIIEKSNILNRVGRGIFIVRSLMDSTDFNFTSAGTEVVIKKRIKD